MDSTVIIREPGPDSWPPPLPEELVVRVLLPAMRADDIPAIRLTCRALRVAADAVCHEISLTEPLHESLPVFLSSWARLRSLRQVSLEDATDAGLAAFAAVALPRLAHLTGLSVDLRCSYSDDDDDDDEAIPGPDPAPNGALALAAQLSSLRRLESFVWTQTLDDVGPPSAWAFANALARLPALRELEAPSGVTGEMLRRPYDELGAGAWRSLEVLSAAGWQTGCIKALARAPLTRLTALRLSSVTCAPVDRPGAALTGAPWAPQLRKLELAVNQMHPRLMCNLQLPNLTRLFLSAEQPRADATFLAGWRLPKLQSLSTVFGIFGPEAAAALAALPLPALTRLEFVGGNLPPGETAETFVSLFNPNNGWLPQLQKLSITGTEHRGAEAWTAMAAAPLTGLRELSITDAGLDAASAAALGAAGWLRGLTKLSFHTLSWAGTARLSDEAAAALRAGGGGFAELEAAGQVTI